jgi:DNA-binding NtrC family response regulator
MHASFAAAVQAASSVSLPPVPVFDGEGHLRQLEQIERDLIELAIDHYAGHMSEVARRLGIGRSTLYRKLREYGLEERVASEG